MKRKRKYVFRWKELGVKVDPSVANSKSEVWRWAVANLQSLNGASKKRNEIFLRKHGEVVEVRP